MLRLPEPEHSARSDCLDQETGKDSEFSLLAADPVENFLIGRVRRSEFLQTDPR